MEATKNKNWIENLLFHVPNFNYYQFMLDLHLNYIFVAITVVKVVDKSSVTKD